MKISKTDDPRTYHKTKRKEDRERLGLGLEKFKKPLIIDLCVFVVQLTVDMP